MLSRVNRKLISILKSIKGIIGTAKDRPVQLRERFPEHEFGRGTYGSLIIKQWGEGATLKIGSFCSIAAGVQIFLGGEHRPDWVTTYPFNILWPKAKGFMGHPKTKGDVIIGHDVWIGAEAIILSGVSVGNGSVIGARSVVTKSVPPYSIVVGNPARVVRQRFNKSTVERLEAAKWWDWPDDLIQLAMADLLSVDIDAFLENAEADYYHQVAQKST